MGEEVTMHYVCSDLHGQYDMFLEVVRKIHLKKHDSLYIIGDVIDRGPEPVLLLLDIMRRKNVTLMIGNHEHMMLRALLYGDSNSMSNWMLNGGETTLEQFERLSGSQQKKLLGWLNERPLVIPGLHVNGHSYYLAHASHTRYAEKEVLRYCDAGLANIEQIVWSREYQYPDMKRLGYMYHRLYAEYPCTTLIIGHTPVYRCSYGLMSENGYARISPGAKGHFYNIDCGCVSGRSLGCLRLEDMEEFYSDRKNILRNKGGKK